MTRQDATQFIERWFNEVWVKHSVDNLKNYYHKDVVIMANGKQFNRDKIIDHCLWCRENEHINRFQFKDVISDDNKIAFLVKFYYTNKEGDNLAGENIGIMHLNNEHKIIKLDVKSSEDIVTS